MRAYREEGGDGEGMGEGGEGRRGMRGSRRRLVAEKMSNSRRVHLCEESITVLTLTPLTGTVWTVAARSATSDTG